MLKEFKKFALRGNLIDLTIGFIIGSAFTKVINSIVSDIIMPPLGLLIGRVNFSNLYIDLSRRHYSSYQAAQAAGAPTLNVGVFLNNVVNFLIVAVVLFFFVRGLNKLSSLHHQEEAKEVRTCPYCISDISDDATRCPHCTSHLPKVEMGNHSS